MLIVQVCATHEKAEACAACLLVAAATCLASCGPPLPTPIWVACEGGCLATAAAGACRPLCGGG